MDSNFRAYLIRILNEGKRLDRQNPLDYRPIKIEYSISETAEGSARVTIGDTVVLAGIKLEIGTPYPDTPDQGSIQVGAELVPLSNPEFELGPPTLQAIELARVVDRGIRESKALDLKSLCIKERESAWVVVADIVSLNDAGNLIDAASLAVLAALKDARYPTVIEGDAIDYKHKTDKKIELTKLPVAVTVHKVGTHFIVDPTHEEEKASDARLTISSTEDGNLCALQKGGEDSLTSEEVAKMIDIALEKAPGLRNAL